MNNQREDLPRISVDSLQDWQRVKASYASVALSILEEELASNGSSTEDSALRNYVQQFIDAAFEISLPNLRVNGHNLEGSSMDEQEIEPFDEGFDRHIWSLSEQSLKWDREIAARRRTSPATVEQMMQRLIDRHIELEEAALLESGVDDEQIVEDNDPTNYEDIEDVSMKTYAMSEELNQSVTLQSERSERIRIVAAELKALKP